MISDDGDYMMSDGGDYSMMICDSGDYSVLWYDVIILRYVMMVIDYSMLWCVDVISVLWCDYIVLCDNYRML